MRIVELTLPVSDTHAVSAYFRDVLQLHVEDHKIKTGWSTLILRAAGKHPVGGVHLAFNVPDNRFADAMAWLRARTPLQHDRDGKDHFALESSWQSQSVYFTGPDGLILELIGRRRLPASSRTGVFHGNELTCLSEVGLPTADVPATRQAIGTRFGLQPLSTPSAEFAPMGDDEGLLILSDTRRRWFPEQKDLPNAQGIEVVIETRAGTSECHDAAQGWRVRAR
ncbi:VOC family protein [Stenotrophomonas tumulicola]|uniref:VOC family protein n=1 Tax=Stenotrophomonas tumulicola TaxID=1685415 RepID=A0A7W3FMG1_9GAMM|nr:VOC family protein [Stenotrophomonas tumulicola]MBA8682248.1 VOC family protein [Stenotrophomonas tumulicola]